MEDQYSIIEQEEGGFSAEVITADCSRHTSSGFQTRQAALNWVGELLTVRPDRRPYRLSRTTEDDI
jgi:hypothetical protein